MTAQHDGDPVQPKTARGPQYGVGRRVLTFVASTALVLATPFLAGCGPTDANPGVTAGTEQGQGVGNVNQMPDNINDFMATIQAQGYTPNKHDPNMQDGVWATWGSDGGRAAAFCGHDPTAITYLPGGKIGQWQVNHDFYLASDNSGLPKCKV